MSITKSKNMQFATVVMKSGCDEAKDALAPSRRGGHGGNSQDVSEDRCDAVLV